MQSLKEAKEALLLGLRDRAIPVFAVRPNAEDNLALLAARKQIFAALLNRIAYLHINSPAPESFYVGEPYVKDKRKVNCIITANFIFPGTILPFEFWLHGARVFGYQHGNVLHIQVHRRISQQLWDDVRLRIPFKEKFIIGYLASCMPTINRRLLDNRYYEGHLLSRTFAIFEARVVSLSVNHRRIQLRWPVSFAPFPPSANVARTIRARSIDHLIDAMDSYFTSDFDDCIRRIVTSAETFFEERRWSARPLPNTLFRRFLRLLGLRVQERSNTFRRVLSDNVAKRKLSDQVIKDNMQFVYTVRNRIVHNGFRMSTSSGLFCDKAIATLKYLIAGYCENAVISRYANSLYMQFRMQCGEFGELYNLDVIEKRQTRAADKSAPVVDSAAAMNQFMFGALRFTERDKFSISR
jgi:hypothetical protein